MESLSEVKVVTSSYQAEYARSAGLQVNAVTKSGSNQFHGSLYEVARNSNWNSNRKTNILNGDAKPVVGLRAMARVYAGWGFSQAFYWHEEYEKLGYTLCGTIDDFPPGHQRFYLQKRVAPAAG